MTQRKRRAITAKSGARPKRAVRPKRVVQPPRRRTTRWWIAGAAAVLFALGLYLGVRVGTPPPPPDFGQLVAEAPQGDEPVWSPVVVTNAPSPTDDALPSLDDDGTRRTAEAGNERTAAAPMVDEVVVRTQSLLRQPAPPPGARPRLAIVIDDLGRSLAEVEALTRIGVPLTYAVLPFETRTAEVVARLAEHGVEILCHLPMEAQSGLNPGPGALHRSMKTDELIAATQRALAAVPGAVGANNHMGSGFSTERASMHAVLGVLADRGLYFLDSRTAPNTVGYTLARQLGVAAAERQVFLDTRRDRAFIQQQVQQLLEMAITRGGAIAIGHPYPETLRILAEELPRAVAQGFELVPVSRLLENSG